MPLVCSICFLLNGFFVLILKKEETGPAVPAVSQGPYNASPGMQFPSVPASFPNNNNMAPPPPYSPPYAQAAFPSPPPPQPDYGVLPTPGAPPQTNEAPGIDDLLARFNNLKK